MYSIPCIWWFSLMKPIFINFWMSVMIFPPLKTLPIPRFEKLDLRRSGSQAKSLGAVVAVTGAFIITLYKGPQLLMASSNSSFPTPRQLLHSQQSEWVIGGFLFLVTALSSATWNISQVKEFSHKLSTFEHQNTWGLPYNEFTPCVLGYCVWNILSKFQSSNWNNVFIQFKPYMWAIVSVNLLANLCWLTTIYCWVVFLFPGCYCQEVPRRNDHSLLLYPLCNNPSCYFLGHNGKKSKCMEIVNNCWNTYHCFHGKKNTDNLISKSNIQIYIWGCFRLYSEVFSGLLFIRGAYARRGLPM